MCVKGGSAGVDVDVGMCACTCVRVCIFVYVCTVDREIAIMRAGAPAAIWSPFNR